MGCVGGGWLLTQHGELGPAGPQRGFGGLALVHGVIGEFGVGDLQVVLARVGRAHDAVARPGCGDSTGEEGGVSTEGMGFTQILQGFGGGDAPQCLFSRWRGPVQE